MQNVRNEKFLRRLAKNLKLARKKRGVSQEELALMTDLTQSQIARIETAKINPTVCTIDVILKALDANANELFH